MAELKEKKVADIYTRTWITQNSIEIISRYEKGELTIRALHYQLVGLGMHNTFQHYKRVVGAMIEARWNSEVRFDAFSDHDRELLGDTPYAETVLEDKIDFGKRQVSGWMRQYFKNRWENQHYYPEVWIEKKALQGIFKKPCEDMDVALFACKGNPSLTALYDAERRFSDAEDEGKTPVILYFGDYDATGEDIPRSIIENLSRLGTDVDLRRIMLTEEQVVEMNLPIAPTKVTDSRAAAWTGLGQVELDAVDIHVLRERCTEAIMSIFDEERYTDLVEEEREEKKEYMKELKQYVQDMKIEDDEDDQDEDI